MKKTVISLTKFLLLLAALLLPRFAPAQGSITDQWGRVVSGTNMIPTDTTAWPSLFYGKQPASTTLTNVSGYTLHTNALVTTQVTTNGSGTVATWVQTTNTFIYLGP